MISNLISSVSAHTVRRLACNATRLDAGGGIAKVWTRANDDVTYPLSAENTPPLAPNRLLDAALFLLFYYFTVSNNPAI